MSQQTQERVVRAHNGWYALIANLLLLATTVGLFVSFVRGGPNFWLLIPTAVSLIATFLTAGGFFTLQPNNACVLTLFGDYRGTVRDSGLHWVNPFMSKMKVTLRARNFNGPTLKVNDRRGNPIEIGAVVVWRVDDTAKACFDVDDYSAFVEIQSESALRHMANDYAYDDGEEGEKTLRSDVDAVSDTLQSELMERLSAAGVIVTEARLSHLAYAPEIAGAMLRRQQAEAIIAARKKIVHGAVSMVEMALDGLSENEIVEMDQTQKASLISNLLVVLCSENETQPIVNTSSSPA